MVLFIFVEPFTIWFITLSEQFLISFDILIFKEEIYFMFSTFPFSTMAFPTIPTLCPPLKVTNPFFISSIKECIEYLHII